MRAIYVRTSVEGNDGAAQVHELMRQAVAREWLTEKGADALEAAFASQPSWLHTNGGVALYVDRGESGANASRPAWDHLLMAARRGEVVEVMATEMARLGRSLINVIMVLRELHQLKCNVVLTRQGFDFSTPMGRAMAAMNAVFAELYLDEHRQRIQSGMEKARRKGTRSGKPIGRPERSVDVDRAWNLKNGADRADCQGRSWAEVARIMGVPAATLRRKCEAAWQEANGGQKVGAETA